MSAPIKLPMAVSAEILAEVHETTHRAYGRRLDRLTEDMEPAQMIAVALYLLDQAGVSAVQQARIAKEVL